MLAKRAERFGVKSEDAKKLARAQRYIKGYCSL